MIKDETNVIIGFNHIELIIISPDMDPTVPWNTFNKLEIFEQGDGWIIYDNTEGDINPQHFANIPNSQIIKNMDVNELFSLIILKNKKYD